MTASDPFAVLGIAPTATPGEVKAAYRARVRALHPDVGGDADVFLAAKEAAERALSFASGDEPNPYLRTADHTIYVSSYDRHAHSPPPPPNVWSSRVLGGTLFWVLPVAGVIFMVAGATGPYFLPVFAAGMVVLGAVVWLVLGHRRREIARARGRGD
ncbi:MAG: J domain-containing protein [Candidatus Nanopelagicales bacterium]